jgi:hypothetical protein
MLLLYPCKVVSVIWFANKPWLFAVNSPLKVMPHTKEMLTDVANKMPPTTNIL